METLIEAYGRLKRERPPEPEDPSVAASARAARILIVDKVRSEALADEDIAAVSALFPDWAPGLDVSVGEVYRWDHTLVEVVQAHTTQADWEPGDTPALWKVHRSAADGPQPWAQPQGGHDAYEAGAQVTHNGKTWTNTHGNGNVWEPGVFGWTEVS